MMSVAWDKEFKIIAGLLPVLIIRDHKLKADFELEMMIAVSYLHVHGQIQEGVCGKAAHHFQMTF